MMSKEGDEMIALELSAETESRLEAHARLSGRSTAECIRALIEDYLQETEYDAVAYQQAAQILSDIRSGREKTYPLREVMREFDVDD